MNGHRGIMMLHLVSKAPFSLSSETFVQKQEISSTDKTFHKEQFLSNFHEISPKLFSLYVQDLRHNLSCSFVLDKQDVLVIEDDLEDTISEDENYFEQGQILPMYVVDFPETDHNLLSHIGLGDSTLQEAVLTRFYLNLLESLFLFCEEQNIKGVILNISDSPKLIETYQNFTHSEAEVTANFGKQTQIMISADVDQYDQLIDLIEKTDYEFCQLLWRHQKGNPTIRDYLKSHMLASA